MPVTSQQLVDREIFYCVSYLVSTLAAGYGESGLPADLGQITEQAFDLCSPIPDYEEAAIYEGWSRNVSPIAGTVTYSKAGDKTAHIFDGWQELCEENNIEPYDREVYEHWIVSSWLADQLEEHGEKVDRDFAGLTIWARTTSGQAIANDYVIEQITAELAASV